MILEIDPQGAMQVKDQMPESVLVFVEAPDMEELRRRLEGRGSETQDEIESRLRHREGGAGVCGHVRLCGNQ